MTPATPAADASPLVDEQKSDAALHWILLGLALCVLLLAATLQATGGTRVVIPVASIQLPELCFARRWLGFECPGCGLTRSLISIMHGRLRDAWQFNPAGILVFGVIAFQIPYRVWQLRRLRSGLPSLSPAWLNLSWAFVGAAMVVQWAARL